MALDAPNDRDEVFDVAGVTVVIAKQDRARVGAARIDVLGDTLMAFALGG
ncbi:MAG: hypothetical protein ABMA64_35355 [Myxococcota bacterium]